MRARLTKLTEVVSVNFVCVLSMNEKIVRLRSKITIALKSRSGKWELAISWKIVMLGSKIATTIAHSEAATSLKSRSGD